MRNNIGHHGLEAYHEHGHEHGHGHGPWQGGPHGRHRGPGRRGPFGGDPREQFRGRFWGHHGGGRERLERGTLRYIILDLLSNGPMHGYEIIRQLEERTQGMYSPSPGTLYPTLQYLEDSEVVRSTQDEGKRVYELTDKGRAELADHADIPQGFWSHFHDRAASGAALHEVNFLKDALNDLTRTVGSGARSAIHAGNPETLRRIRTSLERCQSEIREIIAQSAPARPAAADAHDLDNPDVRQA